MVWASAAADVIRQGNHRNTVGIREAGSRGSREHSRIYRGRGRSVARPAIPEFDLVAGVPAAITAGTINSGPGSTAVFRFLANHFAVNHGQEHPRVADFIDRAFQNIGIHHNQVGELTGFERTLFLVLGVKPGVCS